MEANKEAVVPEYVVGFAFNEDMTKILLQLKSKPDWQLNRYNGPGGKIEPGETAGDAMTREWREETPAGTGRRNWRYFATLRGTPQSHRGNYTLHCFFAVGDVLHAVTKQYGMPGERLGIFLVDQLPLNLLPNVHWLIAMALSFARGETCDAFQIEELP